MTNPLRLDPSRTVLLRKRFMSSMKMRFEAISTEVYKLLVVDSVMSTLTFNANTDNWAFLTDPEKLEAFKRWLQEQIDKHILVAAGGISGEPWTSQFVHSAYRLGIIRSFTEARRGGRKPTDFFIGTHDQFVEQFLGGPIATSRLQLIATRAYDLLNGITADMASKLAVALSNSLAHGYNARRAAAEIRNTVEGITERRALVLARTEIIHAHAEGQLDGLEAMGVERVGAMVEFTTAGSPCPICADMEGDVYTIAEARGVIPVHPNCRCAWSPVIPLPEGITRGRRRSEA